MREERRHYTQKCDLSIEVVVHSAPGPARIPGGYLDGVDQAPTQLTQSTCTTCTTCTTCPRRPACRPAASIPRVCPLPACVQAAGQEAALALSDSTEQQSGLLAKAAADQWPCPPRCSLCPSPTWCKPPGGAGCWRQFLQEASSGRRRWRDIWPGPAGQWRRQGVLGPQGVLALTLGSLAQAAAVAGGSRPA